MGTSPQAFGSNRTASTGTYWSGLGVLGTGVVSFAQVPGPSDPGFDGREQPGRATRCRRPSTGSNRASRASTLVKRGRSQEWEAPGLCRSRAFGSCICARDRHRASSRSGCFRDSTQHGPGIDGRSRAPSFDPCFPQSPSSSPEERGTRPPKLDELPRHSFSEPCLSDPERFAASIPCFRSRESRDATFRSRCRTR